jgi:hypothetical protein
MIRGFIDWECTAPQCVIDIPNSISNIMPLPSSVPIQFTGEKRLVLKISLPLSLSVSLYCDYFASIWAIASSKLLGGFQAKRVLLSKTRLDVIFFPLSI